MSPPAIGPLECVVVGPTIEVMWFIMWWNMWQWSIQSPGLFATNSMSRAWATPTSTVFIGHQADSGMRPASVPVTQKVSPCRCIGWWSMALMFTSRSRTRSPCRTTSGVMYGAARPFSVKKLNSIDMVFGTVEFGRIAHSWMTRAKSRSTAGSHAAFGWMTNRPAIPMPSCMAPCEW